MTEPRNAVAPHLPLNATFESVGMAIAGCSVAELVDRFGTPLQVVDSADIEARARAYLAALAALDRPARAVYATKALPIIAVVAPRSVSHSAKTFESNAGSSVTNANRRRSA